MSATTPARVARDASYGQHGLSPVDRFGVYLSRRAIHRAVGGRRGLEALDLGCGYHASLLRSRGGQVTGGVGVVVRVSGEARADHRFRFVEGTVEATLDAMPDRSFDLVLMISVLEHLWDPAGVLALVRRVTRPGGTVLINVPTWLGKGFLEFSAFRLGTSPACEMDDHKMYYGKRDLWPLLVRAGFRPRDVRLSYHKFGLNLFAAARG